MHQNQLIQLVGFMASVYPPYKMACIRLAKPQLASLYNPPESPSHLRAGLYTDPPRLNVNVSPHLNGKQSTTPYNNQRVAHVRQRTSRSLLMLFLRTLLIFALGISVVAAIPVSPMTSSIHRRDPWFREAVEKALGKAPKLPSTDEEAERRLSGLWVQLIDVLVKAPKGLGVSTYKMPYYVYMRITNNEVLQIWSDPKVTLPPDILYSTDGWAREQKGAIKDMIVSSPSRFQQSDVLYVMVML